MFSSLKLAIPLLLQLMGEIFRADGENKSSVGLRLSVLFSLIMIFALVSVTRNYMELYHDVVELRYHNIQLQTEAGALRDEVKTVRKVHANEFTSQCVEEEEVPESYKRPPARKSYPPPTHDRQELLSIING